MKLRLLLIILLILSGSASVTAQDFNRRHFGVGQGLSNLSVLSLMQDSAGNVWAASVDGLNLILNNSIKVMGAGNDGTSQLSGNLIEYLHPAGDGEVWAHTNHGLDRINLRQNRIDYFREFSGTYANAVSPLGHVVVYTPDNQLHVFNKKRGRFELLPMKIRIPFNTLKFMCIDGSEELWMISDTEAVYMPVSETPDGSVSLGTARSLSLGKSPVVWSGNFSDDSLYFITLEGKLFRLHTDNRSICHVLSFPDELRSRGDVSAVTDVGDDYVIGFKTGGSVMLRRRKSSDGFDILPLGISAGVFSIMKDRREGVFWLATDGEGVWRYSTESDIFHSYKFDELPFTVSKPVRAVFKDRNGDLWAGTKGDGIIRYPKSSADSPSAGNAKLLTSSNSSLLDNSVYCFADSRRNLFWIGGDGNGINYWDYASGQIRRLELPASPMLRYIHGIVETGDELWVATVGYGVFRIRLSGGPAPVAKDIRQMYYKPDSPQDNQFFAVASYNDSIVWFGNRGKGLYRHNRRTGKTTVISSGNSTGMLNNDVFAIGKIPGNNLLYVGTSAGLFEVSDTPGRVRMRRIDIGASGSSGTIHALAADKEGNLWASTNYGVVRYNAASHNFRSFGENSGVEITSYCDGAAFGDTDGSSFFGGTNGLLAICPTGAKPDDYMPPVRFLTMAVGDKETYLNPAKRLKISHDDNTFAITFQAVDYGKGHDFRYFYRLEGTSDKWIDNGNSSRIFFTNLAPGNYTLQVRYKNGNAMSPVYELRFSITPPWYASVWARIIYILLVLASFAAIVAAIVRAQRRKRQSIVTRLEHRERVNVYESKLRFFTNITHELCTPLSLISGACQRILGNSSNDENTTRFTSLIQRNARRLNELIQELIEFRRIETEHRTPDVEEVDISAIVAEVADNFNILAEQKRIDFTSSIEERLVWPTDRSGFVTIITNLISNAFKYTPDGGTIDLQIRTENNGEANLLIAEVSNSGRGIAPENINKIFDRYTVLEQFEQKSAAGAIERNGLGLAICHGLTRILSGTISVSSEPNKRTTFRVELPEIPVTRTSHAPVNLHFEEKPVTVEALPDISSANFKFEKGRPTLFIVDDDPETLWFIADTLSNTYNVEPLVSAEQAVGKLAEKRPDLIITDIKMEGMSGLELTAEVKGNKATSHIPVIQLSSLQSETDKVKGLESGADMYITKPFNIDYLRSAVANLLRMDSNIKDYYESPISAFELIDGKMLHKEDKAFVDRMVQIIHDNITNPNLSTQFVADQLRISPRNLYRRLEGITEETPSVIIKKVRFEIARELLLKTNLSIEEIIYKSGFNNRGTFFKLFSANFGCTPRQYREQRLTEAKESLVSGEK